MVVVLEKIWAREQTITEALARLNEQVQYEKVVGLFQAIVMVLLILVLWRQGYLEIALLDDFAIPPRLKAVFDLVQLGGDAKRRED